MSINGMIQQRDARQYMIHARMLSLRSDWKISFDKDSSWTLNSWFHILRCGRKKLLNPSFWPVQPKM